MTTRYMDPIGGNNANDGLSFANRKQTFSGFAAPGVGDEIRVIASYDDVNLGSATWTDNSNTVTLAAAKTLEITPATAAWTAAANVTCNTNALRKLGATSSQFSIAAGFTTGQAAYFTLPATLDLSAYEGISFWLYLTTSGSLSSGDFSVNLCSDTVGAVPVNTLQMTLASYSIDGIYSVSQWQTILLDSGAALGSVINSISLNFNTDPGTCAFSLNNIFACKTRSHADHLSLLSAISKKITGELEYYGIRSIVGTSIVISAGAATASVPGNNWRGATGAVTTYACVPFPTFFSVQQTISVAAGTNASPITFSGGWDRTAMTTQSGDTWWCLQNVFTAAITLSGTGAFAVTNMSYAMIVGDLIAFSAVTASARLQGNHIAGSRGSLSLAGSSQIGAFMFDFKTVARLASSLNGILADNIKNKVRVDSIKLGEATGISIGGDSFPYPDTSKNDVVVKSISYCATGMSVAAGASGIIRGIESLVGNTIDVTASSGKLFLINCPTTTKTAVNSVVAGIYETAIGGDPLAQRVTKIFGSYFTQTAVRRTASGVAWQIAPTSTLRVYVDQPFTFSLARVAVAAASLVTVQVWCRRDNTGLEVGMQVLAGNITGVADTTVLMTAAINTWQQITLTFTPTNAGVIEIFGIAYGGTTFNGYFDDFTVSQA